LVKILMKKAFTIISLFLSFYSHGQSDSVLFSFFVAGHTYGYNGFHPPFKQSFEYLQNRSEIEFGVLTGDIVSAFPKTQDWDKIDAELNELGIPVYFAVGNHDMENRPLFESRYGLTYYSFSFKKNLFIILDPNIDGWNISGDQLQFLQNTINHNASTVNNIYVFFHQILWKESNSMFDYIKWNSSAGLENPINFWAEIVPIFLKLDNQVTMFSGDLGASWSTNISYDRYGNITFIASGMGDEDGDNFIVVNIMEDGSSSYDLICMPDTISNCSGVLSDYLVVNEQPFLEKTSVYPNPTRGVVNISLSNQTSATIQIFNLQGTLILEERFNSTSELDVNLEKFSPGIYFGRVSSSFSQSRFKVIRK
jgi:hypothetical protein